VPGTEFTCLDTVITLNVLYNPGLYWGAPPSYLWQTQGGQILTDPAATTVQVRGAGTYFFQVQSVLSSCMDTASITLTVSEDVPEVVIQMPETLTCVTTSVQLDASGSSQGTDFAYQWSTQDGQVVTGGSTLTPTVSQPGTYLLTIADNINQCSSTGTVTVLQNVTPPLADAGPDITLDCGEDYPLLDGGASMGQGPLTYAWSTPDGLIVGPANQALLSINRPGKYVLQVTDTTNGCQDSTVVEVHLTDGLVVSGVFVHDLLCHGDQHGEVGIAGVSGGTPPYTMQVGSVAQPAPGSMTGLAEGAYLLRVFDAGGCIWDSLINLWAPPPIQINLGPDVELQMGASHVFVPAVSGGTPPYGFTWFQGGDEVCTVCPSYTASPITDTEVMLYLIDANGCVALATVRMRVFSVKSVYIPNSFSPNYDGINDLFVVYGGDVVRRVRRLAVFDRWGNALYDVADLPADGTAGWDGHYRGQLMDPGVYVYAAEIEFEDGVIRLYKGDVTLLR
jgi:gliding motility-associated-like protein